MYPKVKIQLNHYEHNVKHLLEILHHQKISMMAVSKVFCADPHLIEVLNGTTVDFIADSKIENLKVIQTHKPKVLLRIPQLSEVMDVVRYSDISLNSELEVIYALNGAARRENKLHSIILMFDIGDLREGIYYKEGFLLTVERILALDHIHLKGIGTNLTCYGGVIPTPETLTKLEKIKDEIETAFNIHLEIISGGNSSALPMIFNIEMPVWINNVRVGEALVLGRETAYGNPISGMYDDVFTLEAEIIELKVKPSMPEGLLGYDAFGNKVSFKDEGIMTRAILGIGRQDVDPKDLIPVEQIRILGGSSDHLIVNLMDTKHKLGDILSFKLTYGGILRLMTSPYVRRAYDK